MWFDCDIDDTSVEDNKDEFSDSNDEGKTIHSNNYKEEIYSQENKYKVWSEPYSHLKHNTESLVVMVSYHILLFLCHFYYNCHINLVNNIFNPSEVSMSPILLEPQSANNSP